MSIDAQKLHADEPGLERLIEIARDRVGAVQVWVFGSRASGRSHEGSDWDILCVVPDDISEHVLDDPVVPWRIGKEAGLIADVLLITEQDFRDFSNVVNTVAHIVSEQGIRIDGDLDRAVL